MQTLTSQKRLKLFFENQFLHLLILAVVFRAVWHAYDLSELPPGKWLFLSTDQWFLIATISPVVHQIYVWVCWRSELYYKALSRVFGAKAFPLFSILFGLLIFIRFFSIIGICFADRQSLDISPSILKPAAFLIHLPSLYAIYSVIRYFGIRRIPGEDHFKPEKYKHIPFVRKGMYKYSKNVMYVYVGLIFAATAIYCGSKAGLLITVYMYATVWTHYFCTEKPDIRYIYT